MKLHSLFANRVNINAGIFAQRPISSFLPPLCNHGKNNNPLDRRRNRLVAQVGGPVQQQLQAGGKRLSVQVLQPGERTLFQCAEQKAKPRRRKQVLGDSTNSNHHRCAQLLRRRKREECAGLENLDDYSSFYPFQDLFE
ncbi:Hypothetical_protein [Hexamita inflata]|uniref:Hypothetical_protein n=1 Tax=Hexamita inflata TaxID=28002 RepID=A0AA86R7D4_9EUKA|nr:Hypothetical protein HINF_LOCUS60411 [Hexamita inflata]